jgi:gamma-glutamylcyclotransferase (GGCT)/AIG2-like uncharacterized protein YtfP
MVLKILAEVALSVTAFGAGGIWWQLWKRQKFLKKVVNDEILLNSLISKEALANPPVGILPYAAKNEIGFFVNIEVVLRADQTSQRIPRLLATGVLVLALIGSAMLGKTFLLINLGIFLLVGFVPIMETAKENANEHVLTICLVLHEWRTENARECDEFVARVHGLQKLYDAVQRVTGQRMQEELVFAYGSNMDPQQMRERCPESGLSWFLARAEGWGLCFPRLSVKRKGGVGSIERRLGHDVWGVVFSVTQKDLDRLDQFEGVASKAYQRDRIEVVKRDGDRIKVWTYFGVPQNTPVCEYPPHKEYLSLYVMGGEHFGLPESYLDELKGIRTRGADD